jgi:O-methyltransferase
LTGDQRQLATEIRRLRAQVAAFEASRWWRLHPRFALQRLRAETGQAPKEAQEERRDEPLPDDFGEADRELWRQVSPYTMTSPGKIHALARAVEYVVARPISGAFVECGVWRGGSVMAIALTLLRLGKTDRELYLFDTFEGMTAPGEQDVKQGGRRASEILQTEGRDSSFWAIAPLDDVRENVLGLGYPEERIHFVRGAVEETLPREAPAEVALLRLDTDWYSSTKRELTHLYPRLAQGGVLMIDDYAYWRGQRQAVDEYVNENELALLLVRIDQGARVAIKP